jgi:hypothetical protein
MDDEINNHANLAERLSKFDRKLNPKESLKDEVIFKHIKQQAQPRLYLTQFEYPRND